MSTEIHPSNDTRAQGTDLGRGSWTPAATPRRGPARARLRRLHRWLGVSAGALLIVTGLSGSLLVFRQEIDAALNPHLLRTEPAATRVPLQQILNGVRQQYADPAPTRVRMPRSRDATYEVWLGAAPERYVYADPYRGTLLGARRPTEFLTGWLFLLHSHLLAGAVGGQVAGVGALALVLLSVTGLVIWWPRRAPWRAWMQRRASLTVARGVGGRRLTFDVHRAVGFYASALLFVGGLTGASLAFPKAGERVASWVTLSPTARAPLAPASRAIAPMLPVDSLLLIAERAQPGGEISYLYLPSAPGQPFRVRKRLPRERHPNGKSFVSVDPITGQVLGVEDGTTAPRGARLYSLLYPLHIGEIGGAPTRLLASLTGLTLPLLAVTGLIQWWRRRRPDRVRTSGD